MTTLDLSLFSNDLIEALLETEVGFGGVVPRDGECQRQLDELQLLGLVSRNTKGSWNATDRLREEFPIGGVKLR